MQRLVSPVSDLLTVPVYLTGGLDAQDDRAAYDWPRCLKYEANERQIARDRPSEIVPLTRLPH